MRNKTVSILITLVLVGSVAAFLLTKHNRTSSAATVPLTLPAAPVAPVLRQSISSNLRVSGVFTPYQEVDLHAKVSGYIRRINVDIGDRVRTGQIIATLEVPELNAQVAAAQAQVRHSQSEISRGQSEVTRAESNHIALHAAYTRLQGAATQRPGLIAQQELDDSRAKDQDAEAQINVAKSALAATEQQLGVSKADNQRVQAMSDYSVVTSPFNGVITQRYADTGSLIQAGTTSNTQAMPVVRVAQSDVLRLRMPIPEADVRFIADGSIVQVTVGAIARVFNAKIVRFTHALDASTRTMLAEVDVPNGDLSLSPGMYADTQIVLQHRSNILTVPLQAIVESGDHSYVLVVDKSNKVEEKRVQLGIQGENRREITGDLSEGDSVIVSGQTSYQAGEVVRPQLTASSSAGKEGNQ